MDYEISAEAAAVIQKLRWLKNKPYIESSVRKRCTMV